MLACGGADEEKPPPALRSLDDIYAEIGLTSTEAAPYKDEQTAEYMRIINELRRENERLIAENNEFRLRVDDSDADTVSGETNTKHLGEFEATFYTAFCPTGCTGITATGIDVRNTIYHAGKRIIAVDPKVIPLGSTVKVTLANGNSFEAVAGDTGGAIKGRRIDVLVASRDEAYKLGRMTAKVEIIND